jgi:hypothetical protein
MTTSNLESVFRRWHWLFVPVLAIVAYATVLRIGFLGDDFTLLAQAERRPFTFELLMPPPGWFLYRPVGLLFTWDLGALLWGHNPFPLHLQSLLFHAITALSLGLWLAEATSRNVLGWLAGSLFAIFPLHLEAVGWLAAQWDVMSAMFGTLAMWLFTLWWQRGDSINYLLSLLLYTLAIFTKDSLLTFLPMLALSAWLVTPRPGYKDMLRALYGLIPFGAVLALNLGLRLSAWGNLGGYPGVRTDYANFFWDGLLGHIHAMLSPINSLVLGSTVAQVVGILSTLALLVGLTLYGRRWWRLLVVATAWILLALVPVLNLPIKADDLQQNRLLYLASVGYCSLAAALMYSALVAAGKWRKPAGVLLGFVALLAIVACWVQLRPWHIATVQANELNQELLQVIPPPATPRSGVMIWHLETPPRDYKGAYLLDLAIGAARHVLDWRHVPGVKSTESATEVPLFKDPFDSFAIRFAYHEDETRFHVDYVAGITTAGPPPSPQEAGSGLIVWDFRDCAPGVASAWEVREARGSCEPGPTDGIILRENKGDAQLIGPPVDIHPSASGARFVRLRVSVRYPVRVADAPFMGRWYWKGPGEDWSKERRQRLDIREDSVPHVYWTFLPASDAGEAIYGLRFDPSNGSDAAIQWIAADLVR